MIDVAEARKLSEDSDDDDDGKGKGKGKGDGSSMARDSTPGSWLGCLDTASPRVFAYAGT